MTSNAIADKHEGLREQIERIVTSETFRTSEGLQRLLRYLGDKMASGEGGHLKEYTIGVEGLGRPSSYDPGHDAAVRMQVGRLRQKLAEYYGGEGKGDPFLLTLPKGGFALSFGATFQVTEPAPRPGQSLPPETVRIRRKRYAILYAAEYLRSGRVVRHSLGASDFGPSQAFPHGRRFNAGSAGALAAVSGFGPSLVDWHCRS